MSTAIFPSRLFTVQQGEAPLERCRKWAAENSVQGDRQMPMIVVQIEQPTGREFMAGTFDALWGGVMQLGANDGARNWHEVVVDGPCKLYCDLEMKFTDAQVHSRIAEKMVAELEKSSAAFIQFVLDRAAAKYGVKLEPFEMQSHKASKWSVHVIFGGAIWRNRVHCGAFMRACWEAFGEIDPLVFNYVDPNVYDANHSLRMYRASKLEEPERSMLTVSGENAPPEKPDRELWLRSLITYFPFQSGSLKYASSAHLHSRYDELASLDPETPRLLEHEGCARGSQLKNSTSLLGRPAFAPASGSRRANAGATPEQLAALTAAQPVVAEALAEYKPNAARITLVPNAPLLRVESHSRECGILRGVHSQQHIYFLINYLENTWAQCCWDSECSQVRKQWLPIENGDMEQVCANLRAAWPATHPMRAAVKRWFSESSFVRQESVSKKK